MDGTFRFSIADVPDGLRRAAKSLQQTYRTACAVPLNLVRLPTYRTACAVPLNHFNRRTGRLAPCR